MATHRSAASFRVALAKRFQGFEGNLLDAHKQIVKEVAQDHLDLTSGTIKAEELRKAGHPFGRTAGGAQRGGKAKGRRRYAPLPINKQTGRLQRSRTVRGPKGKDHAYEVFFMAPYAKFVTGPRGTRRMIARGFFDEIRGRHRARLQGLTLAARKGLMRL